MSLVYVETSIPSLLTSRISGDIVVAAKQKQTRDWWESEAPKHDLVTSGLVIAEISRGDPDAAKRRLEAIHGIKILKSNEDVETLFDGYLAKLSLPMKARIDVLHIAFAVAFATDILLTWNCAHIANPETIRNLVRLNDSLGRETPLLLTPGQYFEHEAGRTP